MNSGTIYILIKDRVGEARSLVGVRRFLQQACANRWGRFAIRSLPRSRPAPLVACAGPAPSVQKKKILSAPCASPQILLSLAQIGLNAPLHKPPNQNHGGHWLASSGNMAHLLGGGGSGQEVRDGRVVEAGDGAVPQGDRGGGCTAGDGEERRRIRN
jgi:hypothetical protein